MRLCIIKECGREYLAKGYCMIHYYRSHNGYNMNKPIQNYSPSNLCIIEECKHQAVRHKWCYSHYQTWKRYGNPLEKPQFNYYTGAERTKRYRQRRQGAMLWYKMTHACIDCGTSDPRVLEFDHVRGEKEFILKAAKTKPLNIILAEIEKCDVVCANCHRIRTQERINLGDYGSTTFASLNIMPGVV